MKSLKIYNALTGTAAVILLLILFHRNVHQMGDITQSSRRDSVMIYYYDSTQHAEKHDHFNTENNYYSTPQTIDSAAVIHDYYAHRTVKDFLENDTLLISIVDSLYMNQLKYRQLKWKLKIPLMVEKNLTVTNTVTVHPGGFYAGPYLSIGMQSRQLQTAGVQFQYTTRKNAFGVGFDAINKGIHGTVLFRIK